VVPVPDRATLCGLPKALSATWIDANAAPVFVGSNCTVMVQLAPAPRLAPQVPSPPRANWLALAPARAIPVMLIDEPRLLVKVTIDSELSVPVAWLPKLMLVGLSVTAGVPVPERLTLCGLPVALSVMDSNAYAAAMTLGV